MPDRQALPRRSSGAGDWLTRGRFALLLAALIFAAFPQVLLGLATFVVRDYGFFAYPLAYFQRQCFWRGELPLWDPYNNCGVPFLAQWNTMPLYPPALVYLLLPLNWSLSFFCLAHLFWAGMGMYFLARRWTGHALGASFAGLVFAFNGFSLNLLMWPSHIATLSWMPWVVLAVQQGWAAGGRKLILAAIIGTLQMLAGGPETILFTWLLLLALWVVDLVNGLRTQGRAVPESSSSVSSSSGCSNDSDRQSGRVSKLLWRFPLVVLLVAALAAAQLLPFLDLAAHSQRETGYADARWSMPGWGWANFLVPMVFGSTWKQNLFFQYGQYWTSSYYLGMATLLLAGWAVWTVRDRRVWLLAAAAVLALLLACGENTIVSRGLRRLIPPLTLTTYPVKFLAVDVFAGPLLAAFALADLGGLSAGQKRRILAISGILLALIFAVLFWAWRWPFPSDDVGVTLRNGLARVAFLAGLTGVVWLLARATAPRWARLLPVLLLVVCWLDVWTHEPTQNPTVPTWIYQPNLARNELAMKPQPALGGSRALVAPEAEQTFLKLVLPDAKDNFLAKRLGYFADCNLLDQVPKVNGFFSIYPRECGELTANLYTSTNPCPAHLADFMCVSQATAPGEYTKWRARDSYLPLVTAGQQPVFLDDTNALFALLDPKFDPARMVFLPPELRSSISVTNQTRATAVLESIQRERLEFRVEAKEPSLVVIAQTFYHPWRAFIDGAPQRLLRANYAFQGLELPAGTHHVRLVYSDPSFKFGALVSGLTLLGCGAALATLRLRRH